jgi:hypothetical protein
MRPLILGRTAGAAANDDPAAIMSQAIKAPRLPCSPGELITVLK